MSYGPFPPRLSYVSRNRRMSCVTTLHCGAMPNTSHCFKMTAARPQSFSIKSTCAAPRLKSSMPMAPLPAQTSAARAPEMRGLSVSATAWRMRSCVGRNPCARLSTVITRRPRAPATMRSFMALSVEDVLPGGSSDGSLARGDDDLRFDGNVRAACGGQGDALEGERLPCLAQLIDEPGKIPVGPRARPLVQVAAAPAHL